jgi:hypothetical protein
MKKIFRYSALVLGLILGMFFLLMSLDSVPHSTDLRGILGFITQLAPGLFVIVSSLIAFKMPKAGFFIFLSLTIIFTIFFSTYYDIQRFMIVSFPLILITMMLYSSYRKPGKM